MLGKRLITIFRDKTGEVNKMEVSGDITIESGLITAYDKDTNTKYIMPLPTNDSDIIIGIRHN